MPRSDRVELARALRAKGKPNSEIASILRVRPATVRSYFNDPTLDKLRARKASYAGSCLDCDRPTDGNLGRGRSPLRCADCACLFAQAGRKWTPDAILNALIRWTAEQGEPPRASQWRTRKTLAALQLVKDPSEWPVTSTVQRAHITWNLALSAAGLRTLRPGEYPRAAASA
jgi:hypothetical protein